MANETLEIFVKLKGPFVLLKNHFIYLEKNNWKLLNLLKFPWLLLHAQSKVG